VLGRTERIGRLWAGGKDWSTAPLAFTAVSDLAAEPVRRILGPDQPVTVLPNGVDVAAWRVSPVPHDPHEVRLVSAMRLARRKRPIPLLRMVSALRDRVPEGTALRLTILGAGPLRRAIRAVARRHGMAGWVELPGRLDHEQMLDEYRRSDIYVAPARMESFGIAAIEARTAGLPVVALAESGIREFVRDGVEGLLAADDSEMVEAMHRLVTDLVVRQRIADHNRRTPPVQDWPYVQRRAEEEYARAVRLVEHAA
jgi:glycosyltransferase involved in cell wall biosynthesis